MSVESSPASRAVFLSYASQDAEAARRICEALRADGVDVWFDQEGGLEHGDEWDAKIRRQIKECVLFIPLISANTQARHEGYFRLEWELAADRAMSIASGVPFILPVVIDDTREPDALVPDRFRKVQWTRLPGGVVPPDVHARFLKLWSHRVGLVSHEEKRAATATGNAASSPPPARSKPYALFAAVAVAVVALAGWWLSRGDAPKPAPVATASKVTSAALPAAVVSSAEKSAAADKSLVVLPLENLSPDPENAFFTDGMHAEIISTLGRIPDLRVISRNSTLAFKGGAVAIAEVAKKLAVANVITGSVRREKNRVKIQLELRRAGDEALLWSQSYERDLSDQFSTQSEIANDVARALQIRNASGTMQWARLFTNNSEAYDLFLKTLELYNTPFGAGAKGLPMAEECVRRFEKVLQLDPQFSVATSYLSRAHINAASRSTDSKARALHVGEAKRLAEDFSKALPGGAGDGALANYYSNIENNYERSLTYAQNVVRALPNDAAGYNYLGIALSGLGRYREAETTYRHALDIDPLTSSYSENLITALCRLRDEVEMEKVIKRHVSRTGSKASLERIAWAGFIVRAEEPKDPTVVGPRDQLTMLWTTRRFSEALAKSDEVLAGAVSNEFDRAFWLGWKCLLLETMSRNGAERVEAKAKLAALTEKWAQISPDKSVGVRDSLGGGVRQNMGVGLPENLRSLGAWVFSCLERGDDAVSTSKAAVERWNPKSEPRQLWFSEANAAVIFTRFGRKKEAIELLRHLLSVPSEVTVPLLRASPSWDNLRDDPEFKALLADPKNSAPL